MRSPFARSTRAAAFTLALGVHPAAVLAPEGGVVERLATLGAARAVHTTSPLPSGHLLVSGGMATDGTSLSTTEIIDVAGGVVAAAAPMNEARASHTATVLADGRVVIAGGYNGEYLASVEVYDPARERFTALGRLTEGRSGHTATLLPDGRLLLIGGVGRGWTFLASAELFDPATGRSEPVGSLGASRESHTATLLPDGRVLVSGGHRGRREAMEVFATAELYDPGTRQFQATGSLATARHKHDAVLLSDGRVLVLGGADRTDRRHFATTEIYSPRTGSFGAGPSMAQTRYKCQGGSVRLINGDILVASGARTAELLDRRSLTFRTVPGEFPAAYAFATATPLPSGEVVIVGGYGPGNKNTGGVWRFRAQ